MDGSLSVATQGDLCAVLILSGTLALPEASLLRSDYGREMERDLAGYIYWKDFIRWEGVLTR